MVHTDKKVNLSPEDECDMILVYPLYDDIIKALIAKYQQNRPSMYKLFPCVTLFQKVHQKVDKTYPELKLLKTYI